MAGNGFQPIGILGQSGEFTTRQYWIGQNYASNMYYGDPVCMSADGEVVLGTVALINAADLLGVFLGCVYRDSDGRTQFSNRYTASTNNDEGTRAIVADHPLLLMKAKIMTSGVDATFTRVDIGFQADLDPVTGDANLNISRSGIETSGAAATTANYKIVDLTNEVDSPDEFAAVATTYTHAIVIAQPDLHIYGSGLGV